VKNTQSLKNSSINGISVLDIACGSCRDLSDAIVQMGTKSADGYFHCVDAEQKAIEYAKEVLQVNAPEVLFQWEVSNSMGELSGTQA